jgi:hypothetical protein
MRGNILEEMLLIQEPSVFKLYEEMMKISGYFIAPVFTIALLIEYFGEMDFGGVVKKLLLITIFMGSFYQFHTKAVDLSLKTASYTLNKVSPRNLFVKKWFHVKVRTKEQKQWSFLESFAIPNLNDLVATAFFLLAKVFIWLLKLIYSSVYHLTYVFSGLTAILFFLGWTKDAIKGTFQASLWCMFLPFVIVAILSLVGNSIEEIAIAGGLVVAKIDTIIWLFGVTLLLLISPLITFGMVKGDGIHSFGSKMGAMVVSSGLKAAAVSPLLASRMKGFSQKVGTASKNSFLEPSIKELLKKENTPDASKSKLVDKKGAFKSPFSEGRPLEQRLKEAGIEKSEAIAVSKVSGAAPTNGSSKASSGQSQLQFVKRKNEPFKFTPKASAGFSPIKQQSIKRNESALNASTRNRSKGHQSVERNEMPRQRPNHRSVTGKHQPMKKEEKISPRREKREQLRRI